MVGEKLRGREKHWVGQRTMLAQGQISINPPQMQLGWMFEEQCPNLRAMKLWKSLPERGKRRKKLTDETACTLYEGDYQM